MASEGMSSIEVPGLFHVGALEIFNEAKDSVAVTLTDLTHDAKRLAPFDVTQPPGAGVGGKDVGGGVCLQRLRQRWCRAVCYAANGPVHRRRRRLIATR